jgi:chromosome segregation ATPase
VTDLDQLDIMRRAITALGLGQCAPEDLVAEARASSSRREQDRGTIADQRARITDLESALRDLGVNLGGDLQGEVRAINNRTAGDSAAAQHDIDCALRERDRAIDDARTATARIKELEGKIASNVAEAAAREMRIAELERDLAAKDKSLKTAHAALTRICEVIGAPVPCVAEDAVEAVKAQLGDDNDANAHAERAETALAEIGRALADAGAPQAYHLEDGAERPIPDPERIRLLGERVHTLRAQVREVTDATNYLDAIVEGHNALDDRNAPRLADGCVLSLAARIRSLPH